MTDFTRLRGVDGYRVEFPDVFDDMTDTDAEPVIEAAHSSVLEGWEPTTTEMQGSTPLGWSPSSPGATA